MTTNGEVKAAVLLVEARGGEAALVNYRLRPPYYVVDKLFATAVCAGALGGKGESRREDTAEGADLDEVTGAAKLGLLALVSRRV